MAFTTVQTAGGAASALATTNVTTLSPNSGTGNLVVVSVRYIDSGGTISVTSVTDSAGNTYAKALGPIVNGSVKTYQYYGVQSTPASTVTVTFNTAVVSRTIVDEFGGGMTSNLSVFDEANSNTGATATSGNLITAGSLTPTSAGELVVALVATSATSTPHTPDSSFATSNDQTVMFTQYRLSSITSEAVVGSWTGSTTWAILASAFIAAPAPTNKGATLSLMGV